MKVQNRKIHFLILFLSIFSNCYLNPVVNGLLNPVEEENNNVSLGLLGAALGTPTLLITGQIRDPNGVAMVDLVLESSTTNNTRSTLSPYRTDAGGRFYLPYQFGSQNFTVLKDGSSFFTLVITVSSPSEVSSVTSGAPPGLEILSLRTINGSESNNFFELVDAHYIYQSGSMVARLHSAVINNYIESIVFTFSEAPIQTSASGPLTEAWLSQYISISPSAIFQNFTSAPGNTLTIAPSTIAGLQVYDLTLKPGILSATGKALTPRTIRFNYAYAP
ncbi:hypothetical protein [Leptospira perdikensis]|uniref:Carboxypeptidase regulatory-like domain-containing protein n=1 Tax=Leptospira perdikensis TaxID=2484948 RepID=A0A4R9J9Y0_9LEPT|nr:hypothetical protein [Leptospira perdikensis]TGL35707.1 hypothetical protein EHQ49_16790 [Leptospira perdikensis]